MCVSIHPYERVDDLQITTKEGAPLRVIQNPDWFCFGTDAVLLAHFASVKKHAVVADLGTGCGIIPLLLGAKTDAAHITGVELQPDVAEMAQRSVTLNKLDHIIDIVQGDLTALPQRAVYDVVTCNPPYKELTGGKISPNTHQAIARCEVHCTLAQVIAQGARLLKPQGKLAMVHRPERLTDVLCHMRTNGIEPKRLRMVHSAAWQAPTLILVEGIKGANPKLKVEPPLYIYDEAGNYTTHINEIYNSST